MAKRFTDTEKWRDDWWASLSNDYRMIWLYLVDSCSIAGIWKKDFRGLNFNCNTRITEEDFLRVFTGRVIDRPKYYFIPKFLRFQYPKGLNSNKPAILSVVKELHQNNLSTTVNQLFGNDYLIIKDKDKDTVKDNGQRQGQGKLEIFEELFSDSLFVEQLNQAHKGHDFQKAFEECYTHHSNSDRPPKDIKEWRQKLNTWLTIKGDKKNGTARDKRQANADSLKEALANDIRTEFGGG